jgi:hypothetical protein
LLKLEWQYESDQVVVVGWKPDFRIHLANAGMTQSSQNALDVSRFLMAVSSEGRIMGDATGPEIAVRQFAGRRRRRIDVAASVVAVARRGSRS